jgi:hypothetical protein
VRQPEDRESAAFALGPAAGLDPGEMAGQVLDLAVPRLADAAAVFVLDWLLAGGGAGGDDSGDVVVRRLGSRFTGAGHGESGVPGEDFPTWGAVAFAAGSPYARSVHSGQPVLFGQPDDQTMQRMGPGRRDVLARYSSHLAVPVIADGMPAGLITLARGPGRPDFTEGELAMAIGLAAQAGSALASAIRAMEHQQAADALRRGLVPGGPVNPSRLEIAGRCLPAAGNLTGGDWYDVVPLTSGRTGVIVGDVMGHGPRAAAMMAQLRAAAHALANADLAPADLLRQLDRTAITLGDLVYATCVYAIIDPDGAAATIALAGHLPPVLAMPDGVTRVPELPSGLSLGLGTATFGQIRIKLSPGTVLALFTDGLVETRTQPFDQGIRALRAVLARERGTLSDACDAIIRSLAPHPEDDTTVVLARILPEE